MALGSDARIAIAGAGSIGCFIGGLLARAGRTVLFLARPKMAGELAAHGLRLTDFTGFDARLAPARLHVSADPAALKDAALVLVTVKSGDTAAIARDIAAHCDPRVTVLSLQNGVRNVAALRAALPGAQVIGGMVAFNAVQRGEGWFHRATSGRLVIEVGRADAVSLMSVAGLDLGTTHDIAGVQWGKLLLNLNNALNALSGLPLRQELQDREWRRLLAGQIAEALAVLKAAGIAPVSATPAPNVLLPALLRLPGALFRIGAAKMLAIDPQARSSMQDDLVRARPTEIDYLQGEIIRLGARHGIETPLCSGIAALVRQAEAARAGPPGLTPAQVRHASAALRTKTGA